MKHRSGIIVLVLVTMVAGIAVGFSPRIAQPLNYHQFADQRPFFSVPNFFNVVSNAPFLIAGVWGFMIVLGSGNRMLTLRRPALPSAETGSVKG
jgi:hypothetical protein